MKIILLQVGKTTEKWLQQGIAEYQNRLKHYTKFELITLPELKVGKRKADELKQLEGEAILNEVKASDWLVLLDENGESYSSEAFAKRLQKWLNTGPKRVVFVIGGAFGFDDAVYKKAHARLSLSSMTFTHQMVRPFFIEQLYRGFTILKGEKYHNS